MYPVMHNTRTLFGRACTPSSISAAQWWAIHTPRQLRSCSVVNREKVFVELLLYFSEQQINKI